MLDAFAKLVFDEAQRSQWDGVRRSASSVDAARDKLATAWDSAERSLGAGKKDPGEFLRAWLFAAADEGLKIPDAYFGVAKMLHTIDSQCKDLGLDDVIHDEVARLYKAQLRFKKALGIVGSKLGIG